MAQIGLDIFDIIAGLQRINGKAVPKVVETVVGQFDSFLNFFIVLTNCPFNKIFTKLCGEYEVVGIVPLVA